MEHLSETERTAVPSLSKEDFIRYTTLALRTALTQTSAPKATTRSRCCLRQENAFSCM